MSVIRPTSTITLGAELERDRLEFRVSGVTVALAWLRQYTSEHRPEPSVAPKYVRQAIADIEAMNARFRDLAHDRGSTRGIERPR
jgi:hypothetical protein